MRLLAVFRCSTVFDYLLVASSRHVRCCELLFVVVLGLDLTDALGIQVKDYASGEAQQRQDNGC